MRYTPVELRHLGLVAPSAGTSATTTDRIIEDVADSFEEVWRERGELTDKLEEVEKRAGGAQASARTLLATRSSPPNASRPRPEKLRSAKRS